MVRVLIVDDSGFFRRRIRELLESDPRLQVVGEAADGRQAVESVDRLSPDVVTMDVEMPVMDGISACREIMRRRRTPILMFSSLTHEGARATLDALEAGAVDFLPKRFSEIAADSDEARRRLCEKVREVGRRRAAAVPMARPRPAPASRQVVPVPAAGRFRLLVIGTSTGGPVALQRVLTSLPADFPIPVLLVQHMPGSFTRAFADRLNKFCDLEVIEAKTGERVAPGRVLIAPGGKNLLFRRRGGELVAHVTDPEPDQLYVPSVNAMFNSAVEFSPVPILGVVLTGMGNDGADGVVKIKGHGGQAIAESDESCVVFGMPKAAIATGAVDAVRPLGDICSEILCRTHR